MRKKQKKDSFLGYNDNGILLIGEKSEIKKVLKKDYDSANEIRSKKKLKKK